MAQAHRLGLTTIGLPSWMTPEIADTIYRIEEQAEWDNVGDAARQAIREALADTGIASTASWLYLVWGRVQRRGRGLLCGRLYWPQRPWPGPMPIREMGNWVARDFATEYPWDRQFLGYRFDVFGLRPASAADAQQYYPQALWRIRHPDPSSSTGRSALMIGTYRVRVFHQDSPVVGISQWRPGWSDVSTAYSGGTLGDDLRIAERGLKLYHGFTSAAGRRRLEESPSSPGLALAEQALEMIATGGVATIRDAAVRLGMPRYDERRPDLDGLAEKAAERRLRRYIERFRESQGQTE
jgi:hypothetical protein